MKSRRNFLLGIAFFLSSCVSTTPVFDDTLLVGLETTECLGECPVYTIKIYRNGLIEFNGIKYVASKGIHSSRLTESKVSEIEQEMRQRQILKLKSKLKPGHWGCFVFATDHSHIILRASVGGRKKIVSTYLGCESKQVDKVIEIAKYIDEVAKTSRWVEGKAING